MIYALTVIDDEVGGHPGLDDSLTFEVYGGMRPAELGFTITTSGSRMSVDLFGVSGRNAGLRAFLAGLRDAVDVSNNDSDVIFTLEGRRLRLANDEAIRADRMSGCGCWVGATIELVACDEPA